MRKEVLAIERCSADPNQYSARPGSGSRHFTEPDARDEVAVSNLNCCPHGSLLLQNAATRSTPSVSRRAARIMARTLFASRTSPTLMNGRRSAGADASVVAASSRGTAPNLSAGS